MKSTPQHSTPFIVPLSFLVLSSHTHLPPSSFPLFVDQMLLTNDAMEISHAPTPNDIIWENVAIPKSQVTITLLLDIG